MASTLFVKEGEGAALRVASDHVQLRTDRRFQFIDLTELVGERVRQSGVDQGLVLVRTRHTTTAVLINENEPLLLADMEKVLERLAPADYRYGHDDLERRIEPEPGERPNGAAHCKAMLLGASECLEVLEGTIQLGRWQRVFLVELDGPRPRTVSVVVLGSPRA